MKNIYDEERKWEWTQNFHHQKGINKADIKEINEWMRKKFWLYIQIELTFSVCDPVKYPYTLLAIICFLYFIFSFSW